MVFTGLSSAVLAGDYIYTGNVEGVDLWGKVIQLPDGLKPFATTIAEAIKEKTKNKSEIMIYFGSCFGACDVPIDEAKSADINLIIQFGHSAWNFKKKK